MKRIFALLVLLCLLSCSDETELKKSIFIPDPDSPGLPKYSEWGYNTFGAYYDRQPFISNNIGVPVKVVYENNKTSIVFTGQKGTGYYANENSFRMTLILSDFHPLTYADLISLHDTTLELTDPRYEIQLSDDTSDYATEILNGTFRINRAQHLRVDNKPEEVILSGVFEFQARINGEPVTVSTGRFDLGVGEDNFYRY
jgi:hypothetical protein